MGKESQAYAAVSWAVKAYFETTSIHGLRYVNNSHGSLYRVFWVVNLLTAFVLLGILLRQTLDEAEANPTLTNLEEVPIDDVPAPAISILAPKTLREKAYDIRILNSVRACDPNVTAAENPLLKPLVPLMRILKAVIKAYLSRTMPYYYISYYLPQLQSEGKIKLFNEFCAKFTEQAANGSQVAFMEDLSAAIDSTFLVGDIDGVLREKFKLKDESFTCPRYSSQQAAIWVYEYGVVAFKDIYEFGCSDRYLFNVFS